jgi:predicted transcriptional regulator
LVFRIVCLVIVAEDVSAVERPTGRGPYDVGFFEEDYVPTYHELERDNFTMHLRYYYPAQSNGPDAAPDRSDASYPTILYGQRQDDSVTGVPWPLSVEGDSDLLENLSSWGMVMVTYTYDSDAEPQKETKLEWMYSAILDHLEYLNETDDNPLFGMVDKEAFGATGFDAGADWAWIFTSQSRWICKDNRIKAAFSMHHSLSTYTGPAAMGAWYYYNQGWTRVAAPCPYMTQTGESYASPDGDTLELSRHHYNNMLVNTSHPNTLVIVEGEQYDGPVRMDYWISFFLYWLDGKQEYKTFLYGEEIIMDAARGEIDLLFYFNETDIYPPTMIELEASDEFVYMDDSVGISLNITGHPVNHYYPLFQVVWYVNKDEEVITSKESIVFHEFVEPGDYKITAEWSIGGNRGWATPVTINVTNIPPTAVAGPHEVHLDHDSMVILDGGGSWDTESHKDYLEYKWEFPDGTETNFSTDPTCEVNLTTVGTLTATLTVRDLLGAQTITICTIHVVNLAPTVTGEVETVAMEDEVLSFQGEGFDTKSHQGSLLYRWRFDDGSETEWTDSPVASHNYRDEGTYNATLSVKDPLGLIGNYSVKITVHNVVPSGGIDMPADGAKELRDRTITFSCWGNDTFSDFADLLYSWDFGDGETADGAWVEHTYDETGRYNVTLTIEDDDGATFVVSHNLTIEESVEQIINAPQLALVAFSVVVLIGLAVVVTTEPGKYSVGLFAASLFTKTEDVLDNKTRHALLGIIITDPGIHYSAIKEEFGLANGQAAYHLDVLERENFIRSVRDGKLKRFYSVQTKVPEDVGWSPEETREVIVELVQKRPGISQRQVMEELGLSRDAASYYLRELVKEGRLKAGKEGKYTVYHVPRAAR